MLKVTITAYDSPVTVQDPRPVTQNNTEQAVVSVQPNTTREMLMQWGQLERIQQQLTDLAALNLCTFAIEPAGVAQFAEQNENLDAPSIDGVDAGGAGVTIAGKAIAIVGTNLLGGQEMASSSVAADTVDGSVLMEVLNPGYDGNLYDFEVVDSDSGGLVVTPVAVGDRTVISIDLGGSGTEDCTGVADAINTAMAGLVQAAVVGTGATVISTLQAVTAFLGGVGTGISVLFGGIACTVSAIDGSAAPIYTVSVSTPDVASLGLAAGDTAVLKVRSNDKVATANLTLA
jgi:hypothetical protein